MSTLTHDPFDMLTPIREAVNRFMGDGIVSPERLLALGHAFPLDVLDTPEEYVIEATITGVKPEDIRVTAEDSTLTIRTGGRVHPATGKDAVYLRREHVEWPTPEVSRAVTLPTRIDPEQVKATYEHGVLTVRIAKAEQSKARTIPVTVKEPVTVG